MKHRPLTRLIALTAVIGCTSKAPADHPTGVDRCEGVLAHIMPLHNAHQREQRLADVSLLEPFLRQLDGRFDLARRGLLETQADLEELRHHGLIFERPSEEACHLREVELQVVELRFKRLGQPVDIAKGALFLASDLAAFVSGHGLRVDGGLMLRV